MAPKKKAKEEVQEEEPPPPEPEPVGEQLTGDFVFQDGSTYSGQYLKIDEDVTLHGTGTLVTGSEVYRGTFEKGLFKEGTFTAGSGAVYTGAFQDNVFHGVGEYRWPDGRSFKGTWKNGLMHGRGEFANFSFGAEKYHTGFSIQGRFASNREEQEEMKGQFLDEYRSDHYLSAVTALKDLANKTNEEAMPKEFLVPPAQQPESPDVEKALLEREAILELVDGPFPEANGCSQQLLQAFTARLEEGCESPLVVTSVEEKGQCERFDARRLKREQLQTAGQCVMFTAPNAEIGALSLLVLVNTSKEYNVAMAQWKLVYLEEAAAPAG
jgi:hypothetical protein